MTYSQRHEPGLIEFIYFDLGNVIVHFDHHRCSQNLFELTRVSRADCQQFLFASGLQDEYETGHISTAEVVETFNREFNVNVKLEAFERAISDIFWLNRPLIPILTQLHSAGQPMAILSNTCPAHWEFVVTRFPVVGYLFGRRKNILSYQAKSMKPNERIYEVAKVAAEVEPEKILFVDDRTENVEAAKKSGIQSHEFSIARLVRSLAESGIRVNV